MSNYMYIGVHENRRLFYCIENQNLYLEPGKSGKRNAIIAGTVVGGCIGVRLLRFIDGYFMPAPMGIFVACSMVLGLLLAYILEKKVVRSEAKAFFHVEPEREIRQEELERMSKSLWSMSLCYFVVKVLLLLTVLVLPFMIADTGSLLTVVLYPFIWLCFGFLCLYIRPGKRRRAIREFRERYIG